MKTISIARDFSATPGGRFNADGPYSGQAFRVRLLEPAVDSGEDVVVQLDDVAGLPSSFLEEAFGGLFRRKNATRSLLGRVKATTTQRAKQPYVGLIERYMKEAAERVHA